MATLVGGEIETHPPPLFHEVAIASFSKGDRGVFVFAILLMTGGKEIETEQPLLTTNDTLVVSVLVIRDVVSREVFRLPHHLLHLHGGESCEDRLGSVGQC